MLLIAGIPSPLGSRDGAVVRALASHRCGLSLILGPSVTCGLSLLLVLALRFLLRSFQFSSLNKNQHSNIQFNQDRGAI